VKLHILLLLSFIFCYCHAQQPKEKIVLNQIGFYPHAVKKAVLVGAEKASTFFVLNADNRDTVFTATIGKVISSDYSNTQTQILDFTKLSTAGTYVIHVPSVGDSYIFEIKDHLLKDVAKASLKSFYYIRASSAVEEKFGGQWHRNAAHPDDKVKIHASAASKERPEASLISSPRGWYDAGDYNKYVVNSGITTYTLLSLYEDFPQYFNLLNLHIPESDNQIPDILDECLWNIRWLLSMQDPNDGGVYHKLTTASFEGMLIPEQATKQRYVVQKSTAATLDFASVMAQAARIFTKHEDALPSLADSCLLAAERAYEWAIKNSQQIYDQNKLNDKFEPDITTGAYGDDALEDEFFWAASELYISTSKNKYEDKMAETLEGELYIPSWRSVYPLGIYSLVRHADKLNNKKLAGLERKILKFADRLIQGVDQQPFHTIMGKTAKDYNWGSSANAANQGIVLLLAYQLNPKESYLMHALQNMDYLLGRNATGYSFITGYGDKTPMHIHHRPSVADNIEEPIPGLLSGGPNARAPQQDRCEGYQNTAPEATFIDDACSYASNEIAINWNAPLVYLSYALDILIGEHEETNSK